MRIRASQKCQHQDATTLEQGDPSDRSKSTQSRSVSAAKGGAFAAPKSPRSKISRVPNTKTRHFQFPSPKRSLLKGKAVLRAALTDPWSEVFIYY